MKNFDVIIIGGGPAGTMAGIELQKQGLFTCIIDKAQFPRQKLCGGGLTQKTMNLLAKHCPELDKKDFVTGESNRMAFYYRTTCIAKSTINTPFVYTDRSLFDNCLIELYKAYGGTLIENLRIAAKDIDFNANAITAQGTTLHYRYLIGACGCSTLLTKPFRIQRNDYFCMETSMPKTKPGDETCNIYFGLAQNGYGWYFPKNEHDIIGIGGKNSRKELPEQAARFFREVTGQTMPQSKGAFIPSGKRINTLAVRPNVILAGDAAGLIDPITGEGIYYALLSGIYAAESICMVNKTNQKLSAAYTRKCAGIRQNMRWGYLYHRLLYSEKVMNYFLKALQSHPRFVGYYLEEVMSTYRQNYKTFIWHYFTRVRNKTEKG